MYALTSQGAALGRRIAGTLGGRLYLFHSLAPLPDGNTTPFVSLSRLLDETFGRYRQHIFLCAAGVVMRCIAPHLGTKQTDPAVVVLDQQGRFVVSLLSGHLGGANALARRVAAVTGGEAVITTATDTQGLPSLDLVAAERGLALRNPDAVKAVNAALLAGTPVALYDPHNLSGLMSGEYDGLFRPLDGLPDNDACLPGPAVLVTCLDPGLDLNDSPSCLVLHPPLIHVGMGCRRGAPGHDLSAALRDALHEAGIAAAAVAAVASIDAKRDEAGLLEAAAREGLTPQFFSAADLAAMPVSSPSPKAREIFGIDGVCEAAALLSATLAAQKDGGRAALLLKKTIRRGATVALAEHIPGAHLPG